MRIRLAIGLLVVLTACETPTAPSDQGIETLSGTVQPGAFDVTRFFVMKAGMFEVTLRALTPGGASVVGIGLGELSITGRDCSMSGSAKVSAADLGKPAMWPNGPGATKAQVQILEGPHCMKVFDPAYFDPTIPRLERPQSYTFQLAYQ